MKWYTPSFFVFAAAKPLLKSSPLTTKEIADRLNFADEHYFSNIFLPKTGVRPKHY